jgi:hypothetical protein
MVRNKIIENIKKPIVEMDESLDRPENRVYASKKLAMANAFLAKANLPQKEKIAKSRLSIEARLTPIQTELLRFYTMNPTESQMQLLRDFLEQLFSEAFEPAAIGAK